MDKKRDLKVLTNYMEEQFCQRCVIRNECEKISWCPISGLKKNLPDIVEAIPLARELQQIEKKIGIDMLSDFGKFLGEICKE